MSSEMVHGPSPYPYLVPHSWDAWYREKVGFVTTKNAFRELTVIETRRKSKFDFTTRLFTSNCQTCPFYIPKPETEIVITELLTKGGLKFVRPRSPLGICTYAQTYYSQKMIPKFLESGINQVRACVTGQKNINERVKQRRAKWELFSALPV